MGIFWAGDDGRWGTRGKGRPPNSRQKPRSIQRCCFVCFIFRILDTPKTAKQRSLVIVMRRGARAHLDVYTSKFESASKSRQLHYMISYIYNITLYYIYYIYIYIFVLLLLYCVRFYSMYIIYSILLFYIILYYYIIFYHFISYCIILYHIMSYYIILYCIIIRYYYYIFIFILLLLHYNIIILYYFTII